MIFPQRHAMKNDKVPNYFFALAPTGGDEGKVSISSAYRLLKQNGSVTSIICHPITQVPLDSPKRLQIDA